MKRGVVPCYGLAGRRGGVKRLWDWNRYPNVIPLLSGDLLIAMGEFLVTDTFQWLDVLLVDVAPHWVWEWL